MSITPVRFDALPSHTPFSPVRTSERLDPYYDALWSDGTQASWLSKARATRSERAGIGRLPAHLNADPTEVWERFERGLAWEQKLSTLAAVDCWRTLTSEQLAALTGQHKLASGKARATGDLFAADLIEVGVFADAMRAGEKQARGTLFRPAGRSAATDRMENTLTYPEWVSVTAGSGYEFTRQFDRHNLLATELGLRVAEFCRIGTVLGEKLSVVNNLAYTSWGLKPPKLSQQTADFTVVRNDGLRIAVEITASQGATLEAKIEKWAKVLHNRRTDDSGLVVLFIVAGRADSKSHTTTQVMAKTRQYMRGAAVRNPGLSTDRTNKRMFLANWEDWFPGRGETTKEFLQLRAEAATGANHEDPWEEYDLLNEAALPYNPTGDRHLAIFDNTAGLRSTPHWLRNGNPPELWTVSMERQGLGEIPHLTGLTDKGRTRREFASANGAAGPIGLPERLAFTKAAA